MKIGLDFDGVIADYGRLKSDEAKRLYGIKIPPERFRRRLVTGAGILTYEQYNSFIDKICETREIGLAMLPVNGIMEYLPKLQDEEHDLIVITSRNEIASEIAKEWIKLKGLNLPLIGLGSLNKVDACHGLDVYIDDDLDRLEPLVNVVPHRYLFSWGYILGI